MANGPGVMGPLQCMQGFVSERWLAIGLSLRCEQQAAMDTAVEALRWLSEGLLGTWLVLSPLGRGAEEAPGCRGCFFGGERLT